MDITNVCIKNEYITVVVNSRGAEITSIKDADDNERLHQPDMVFWNGQAPILFPVCGKINGGKITHNGKEYKMPNHGFARDMVFDVMETTEDLAVFSLVSDEETKKVYPFDFEFIVTYKLLGNSLDVSYEVINDSDEEMYFCIGSHESYNCIEGLGEYEIHFEKEEPKKPYIYETDKIPSESIASADGHSVLKLSDELFEGSITVVYEKPESSYVYLVNKAEGKKIRVEFGGFSNLLVWTPPRSQFVCIEPWCALPIKDLSSDKLKDRGDTIELEAGGHFENHHIISVL